MDYYISILIVRLLNAEKGANMALVRWSPVSRMLSQWPDLWDEDFMSGIQSGSSNNLDVYETKDEVVVKANVAGVKEEDVDLTFEKGVLWIKAQASEEDSDQDKKHYSKASWSYSYKVAVPGLIDMSQEPQAKIKNGVVSINFKKSEATKPRKLKIQK